MPAHPPNLECHRLIEKLYPEIKDAMSESFNSGIESQSEEAQHHVLMNLLQHFENAESQDRSKQAWGTKEFLQDATTSLFDEIVKVAIDDGDHSAHKEARLILRERQPFLLL